MDDISFISTGELARRIRSREIGCAEILEATLDRVERYDGAINAIVVRDVEKARERAKTADAVLARGDAVGPLHGVPMTVKECFQLTGTPTTYGVEAHRDNIAHKNATTVDRLLWAGANIFGKTNVPPYLADGQSQNPIYGRTNNPWNLERTPGGSSGGAAAAVCAGMSYLEVGSDIASSVRNPAHFCGLFGLKTTYGIISVRGKSLAPTAPDDDISVIGPIARSASDVELALSVIAGPDDAAPSAFPFALPPEHRMRLRDFRVAMIYDDSFAPVDDEVSNQLRTLADFLRAQDATVDEARPALESERLFNTYMLLLRATNGARASEADFAKQQEMTARLAPDAIDMASMTLRGATMSHRRWLQLNIERRRIQDAWDALFTRYDIVLCPPLATAAHPHSNEPVASR
ncbi:MAG TPA: amidase family protein, partial [Candidatus Aquilonibacter sp.]